MDNAINKREDAQFQHEITHLIETAEQTRLKYMQQYQLGKLAGTFASLTLILTGVSAAGWYALMQPAMPKVIGALILTLTLPLLIQGAVKMPLRNYLSRYKADYLPAMGRALGGFAYHPKRGIAESVLRKSGVLPAFTQYHSEDAFRGRYKNIKVIFSEARLKNKRKTVFDGLLVLLELPDDILDGRTVITADREAAKQYARTRWTKLKPVEINPDMQGASRFVVYAHDPAIGELVAGKKLIKELDELAHAFCDAPMAMTFFRKKYIFIALPHEVDMFEANDIFIPICTEKHALACKREIDQLLELIDIFDVYAQSVPLNSDAQA